MKAVGYIRVSTDHQDLSRQESLIRQYCQKNNYCLTKIIGEKVSGAKKDRKSLAELHILDKSLADILVVSELSRLSREADYANVIFIINNILQNGLDVVFLDEESKVYKAGKSLDIIDIITLAIGAKTAADERMKIATRMKTGKTTKIQIEPYMYTGGTAPYGYKIIDNPLYHGQIDNIPAKRLITEDEYQMSNVRLVFQMVLNGTTLRDIAEHLNKSGTLTKQNKPFCETSISKMIKNPIYNGRRRFKGLPLVIKKIISDEDWNKAQICVSQNKLFKDIATSNFNPLKGIVFCPCGYALMLHQMSPRSGQKYYVLACCRKNNKEYRKKCRNMGIKSDVLFKSVWNCVKRSLTLTEYSEKSNKKSEQINTIITQLNQQLVNNHKSMDNIKEEMRHIENAIIKVSDIPSLVDKYKIDYKKKQDEISSKEDSNKAIEEEITKNKQQLERIQKSQAYKQLHDMTDKEKSEIYKNVLDRVVYYSETMFTGFIVIDYKNGLQNIVVSKRHYNNLTLLLPTTFKFNKETRKVVIPLHKHDAKQPYNLDFIKEQEFSLAELSSSYDLEEWKINIDDK
ncbi:MAG: recombinase family protein [Prevotella histicola]|jgi:putative site-specific recombinase|uniref:recombinase family protein n=1 Tax=Prevotella histicola TaxID=470565 RepID=UPI001CB3892E|nr:recombinase family protein [Prevotella histicola]MBF1422682.1 recombinase family protein [Prevotella histicola]